MKNRFTFADNRKIEKVLNVMKDLAKKDDFFAVALEEFNSAVGEEKIHMYNYLLKIYKDAKDNGMSLEQAVILSAY